MLDIISNIIGTSALATGSFLHTAIPFLPASIAQNPATLMVIVGFGGQFLFAMRFIIQWIKSEGEKKSVIPLAFWYFSIGGGLVLLLYALWRRVVLLSISVASIMKMTQYQAHGSFLDR